MTLIFLAGLTPFGYAFIGVILLSFLLAYLWLKSSHTKQKAGCLSVGFTALLIGFVLMFPVLFSFAIIQNGSEIGIIGVAVFWVLVLGLMVYFLTAKNTTAVKKVIFSILKYCLYLIVFGLFLTLVLGMAYYIYVRLFTTEKRDDPIWTAFLCIFFLASLILAGFGLLNRNKEEKKKEKTTFYSLDQAKLKSELVIELDLSKQQLKTFPEEILHFKNLKFLILSHNEISDIPNEINKLQKLVGLDLSNNPISDLERSRIRKLLSKEVEIVF
ncbi:leucine-rich repeat domain-containing protein [Flavobacterium phragmitis]|uniref:Leucine Rich repeat-containing protein n=1 Tax=Flavobacterium phragmitis TaxID=739143 RepID=A0A1I1KJI2_9FLAO|nr:leucine-rich repeat domain-containing protein [Flavobacterium phragmitis]SFC61124.1 Leucine Rich repeat-containing protein [Flavobacterium phragmitis]